MNQQRTFFLLIGLGLSLLSASCQDCKKISILPLTSPTSTIKVGGLYFQAPLNQPGGELSVQDRYPAPAGDGENEIWIPSLPSGAKPGSGAMIKVDPARYPQGLSSLELTCAYFSSCTLQAFDLRGKALGAAKVLDEGINVVHTFTFSGPEIGMIEISGSEISIMEVCPVE